MRCQDCRNLYLKTLLNNKNSNWKGGFTRYELSKRWTKNNPEKARYLGHRARIRRSNAGGSHTFQEWQELKIKYNFMCLCCKEFEPKIALTADHIIPIARGGTDYISNIQPLCRKCNSIKHVKTISYLPLSSNLNYKEKGLVN